MKHIASLAKRVLGISFMSLLNMTSLWGIFIVSLEGFNQSSVRLLRDDFGGDMAGLGVALSHGVDLNRGRFGNFPRAL